jgi:hypothetical protein
LIERCYYAIADNLEILKNLEHATALRNNLSTRLTENRQKLLTDCTVLDPLLLAKFRKIIRDWLNKGIDMSEAEGVGFENAYINRMMIHLGNC